VDDPVLEHCRAAIRDGSKSFYAAARIFDRPTRESAFMLYAWCRHGDDQVDLQDLGRGGPRQAPASSRMRLERLEELTRRALAGKADGEPPAFAALRRVASRHHIPRGEPLELLEGFRMDVEGRSYRTLDDVLLYCFRVAGVVGLMMARIMGVDDDDTLDRATDLGLAFQMTNIARDHAADAAAGRIYLPLDWLEEAGIPPGEDDAPEHAGARFAVIERFLAEAERYYSSSLVGISRLRFRHAWAIAAARLVYRDIGHKILARGSRSSEERAIVSGRRKLALVAASAVQAAWAVTAGRAGRSPARDGLWTRPRAVSAPSADGAPSAS
jgi:phytoene synthase